MAETPADKRKQDLENRKLALELKKIRSERINFDAGANKSDKEKEKINEETRELKKRFFTKSFWHTFTIAIMAALVTLTLGYWQTDINKNELDHKKVQDKINANNNASAQNSSQTLAGTIESKANQVIEAIRDSGRSATTVIQPGNNNIPNKIEVAFPGNKPLVNVTNTPSTPNLPFPDIVTVKVERPAAPDQISSLVSKPFVYELQMSLSVATKEEKEEFTEVLDHYLKEPNNRLKEANILRLMLHFSKDPQLGAALSAIFNENLFRSQPPPYQIQPSSRDLIVSRSETKNSQQKIPKETGLLTVAEESLKDLGKKELGSLLYASQSFLEKNSAILTADEKTQINNFVTLVVKELVGSGKILQNG